MADEHDRHPVRFGQSHEHLGTRPDLDQAAGGTARGRVGHGLDRVHHHQGRAAAPPRRRTAPSGRCRPAPTDRRGSGPRRSARRRTWWADSSAATSSTGDRPRPSTAGPGAARWTCPPRARRPTKVTDPGTRPPPSTRSSSATPVGVRRRLGEVNVTEPFGAPPGGAGRAGQPAEPPKPEDESMAPTPPRPNGRAEATFSVAISGGCSSRTFHSPQLGQRPAHFGVWGVTQRAAIGRAGRAGAGHARTLRMGCDGQAQLRSRRPPRPVRPEEARALRWCGRRWRRPRRRR